MNRFKPITIIGVFLILLGAAAMVINTISFKKREKVIDVGSLEATIEREVSCFEFPIIFGSLNIAAGVILVALDRRGKNEKN